MTRSAKDIFLDALDLPHEQRARFVDACCADDASLRSAVLKLLGDHDRLANSFLHKPAVNDGRAWVSSTIDAHASSPSVQPSSDDEAPGQTIGARYRLEHKLGEGGFGTVWLARQVAPIDRNVAVKILRPGLTSSRQVAARFDAERQTLARMDHPGIARVLDAGATATGRPYFVMEFVADASPITDFVRARRLSVSDRVRLLERVCLAVQHAHTKGVIHRDIKPGNVLVSISNDSAVPRVIDFGIAKALDGTGAELTQDLQVIGTPQYMSPEQAAGASRLVDTRSDVYSLGALLYELVCGVPPFDADELRKLGWTDAMKRLREVDPPAPSTRTGERVDAEIDWIAMKALEKSPSRRYQSAAEMAGDLQRYLAGRAVEAGPATASYRLRKFVARHKLAIASATAVAASLLVAAGVSVALLLNARRTERVAREQALAALQSESEATAAERRAVDSAALARQNLDRAGLLADFTYRLMRSIDPSVAQGRDTALMQDLLADASKRLDARDATIDPTVDITLRSMIGDAYLSLDRSADSLREHRKAQKVIETVGDPEDFDSINAMSALGNALGKAEQHDEAEAVLRDVLARLEKRGLGDTTHAADAMNNLAATVHARGRADEATQLLKRVVDIRVKRQGADHKLTLIAQGNLASAYKAQGRLAEARDIWADVLVRMRATLGPTHTLTLVTLGNLGTTYEVLGEDANAERCFRDTLEARRKTHAPGSPGLVRPLGNLGGLLLRTGKLDEAETLLKEAFEISLKENGPTHELTLLGQARLAGLYRNQKKFDDSVKLSQATIDAYRQKDGPASIGLLRTVSLQLCTQCDAERYADAAATLARELPDGVPDAMSDLDLRRALHVNAGRAFAGTNDLVQAKRHAQAARAITTSRPMSPQTLRRLEETEAAIREAEPK